MTTASPNDLVTLADELQGPLRALLRRDKRFAVATCRTSDRALLRAAAGQPVRQGTVDLIRAGLAAVAIGQE